MTVALGVIISRGRVKCDLMSLERTQAETEETHLERLKCAAVGRAGPDLVTWGRVAGAGA